MKQQLFFLAFLIIPFYGAVCEEVQWPQWRGGNHDSVSNELNIPSTWNEQTGENILWIKPLPQWGHSTPAVWGDKMFLTAELENGDLSCYCLNRNDGSEIWKRTVSNANENLFPEGSRWYEATQTRRVQKFRDEHNLASPSPVTDGEIVAFHFGNGEIVVFDLDGTELWRTNLQKDYGPFSIWWGHANSPVLYRNLIIFTVLQDPCMTDDGKILNDSYLIAYERKTGKIVWRTLRNTGVKDEPADGYVTPPLQFVNGKPQILVLAGLCADAYNPETGERIWYYPDLIGNRNISCPTFAGNVGIFVQGYRKGIVALPLDKTGKLEKTDVLWTQRRDCPDCTNPLYYKGLVFTADNGGKLQCLDAQTGEIYWKTKQDGDHRCSPFGVSGNVIFFNTSGRAVVMKADKEQTEVAVNQIDDVTYALPIVVDGKLYLRGKTKLYCIGTK